MHPLLAPHIELLTRVNSARRLIQQISTRQLRLVLRHLLALLRHIKQKHCPSTPIHQTPHNIAAVHTAIHSRHKSRGGVVWVVR